MVRGGVEEEEVNVSETELTVTRASLLPLPPPLRVLYPCLPPVLYISSTNPISQDGCAWETSILSAEAPVALLLPSLSHHHLLLASLAAIASPYSYCNVREVAQHPPMWMIDIRLEQICPGPQTVVRRLLSSIGPLLPLFKVLAHAYCLCPAFPPTLFVSLCLCSTCLFACQTAPVSAERCSGFLSEFCFLPSVRSQHYTTHRVLSPLSAV